MNDMMNFMKKFMQFVLLIAFLWLFICFTDTHFKWKQSGYRYVLSYSELSVSQQFQPETSETQIVRKQRLKNFCQDINADYIVRGGYERNYIFSPKAKAIFCNVPKTASTNWKRVFKVLDGQYEKVEDVDKRKVHEMFFYEMLKVPPYARKSYFKTHYKFMFSRHPFVRIFATYRDKFLSHNNSYYQTIYKKRIFKRFRPTLPKTEYNKTQVNFLEFVKFVINETGYIDHHWAPTHMICLPCMYRFDYIGKHETLNEDAKIIFDKLNVTGKVKFPGTKVDFMRKSSIMAREYFKQIPKDVMKDLYEYYRLDFEAFGYDPNNLP